MRRNKWTEEGTAWNTDEPRRSVSAYEYDCCSLIVNITTRPHLWTCTFKAQEGRLQHLNKHAPHDNAKFFFLVFYYCEEKGNDTTSFIM